MIGLGQHQISLQHQSMPPCTCYFISLALFVFLFDSDTISQFNRYLILEFKIISLHKRFLLIWKQDPNTSSPVQYFRL